MARLRALPSTVAVAGRGPVLRGRDTVIGAIDSTTAFLTALHGSVQSALERGADLAGCFSAAQSAMAAPFGDWPLFGHVLPFDVARMLEELRGTEHPTIWTAERDQQLWQLLRGSA